MPCHATRLIQIGGLFVFWICVSLFFLPLRPSPVPSDASAKSVSGEGAAEEPAEAPHDEPEEAHEDPVPTPTPEDVISGE